MTNRPKQYGRTSRANDREREEQGRQRQHGPPEESRRGRPRRASESDVWEREEGLDHEAPDIDELDESDESDDLSRTDRDR